MFRAFKLENVWNFPKGSLETGEEIHKKWSRVVQASLEKFVSGGKIDGSRLRDHWFPEVKADLFISHSHADRNGALALAGWLKNEFKLTAFIDSSVWGYSTDLLRKLDNDYALNDDGESFNYATRNVTTSHVHMMLATALSRMIDATECVLFVSTPNSVSHSDGGDAQLSSPWILYELDQLAILRRKTPQRVLIKESRDHNFSAKASKVPIRYKANFDSLTSLTVEDLNTWIEHWNDPIREGTALDRLYAIANHDLL